MRQMSGCVSFNILLGRGSWSTHHPRPRGILPTRRFHYDHLLFRFAMMAQVILGTADLIIGWAEVISLPDLTADYIGLAPGISWALLVAVQRPYGFWACLRKGDWD